MSEVHFRGVVGSAGVRLGEKLQAQILKPGIDTQAYGQPYQPRQWVKQQLFLQKKLHNENILKIKQSEALQTKLND